MFIPVISEGRCVPAALTGLGTKVYGEIGHNPIDPPARVPSIPLEPLKRRLPSRTPRKLHKVNHYTQQCFHISYNVSDMHSENSNDFISIVTLLFIY